MLGKSRNSRSTVAAALVLGLTSPALARDPGEEREEATRRLGRAALVLDQILDAPDKGIPGDLLDRAECVAVIPSMKKAGFIFGGRYGRGAVACRTEGEGSWGPPGMITLGGGSFGLQIGVTAIDMVMLVMNPEGMDYLLKDKFTLGGDVSVAAGPVGRAGTAETDALMTAKILTYSRSRGLFAGLEVKGAALTHDRDANHALYGRPVTAREILLGGDVEVPPGGQVFVGSLTRHSPAHAKR